MRFPLRRFYQDERQTLGILGVGQRTLFTIERPWIHNQPFYSRFPPGSFRMKPIEVERKRKVRLHQVGAVAAERTLLNIEVANWARQLTGCVGIGTAIGFDTNRSRALAPIYMVHDSREALTFLLEEMEQWPDVTMYLDVTDNF